MRFTWDPGKAVTNVRQHGVTFEEATTVFGEPLALIVEDAVDPDRPVTVFIEVRENDIRIISARRATRRERRRYGAGKEG
ncbi:MAG TPA: BrnT family toxin [Methylomirabilota bacterium]